MKKIIALFIFGVALAFLPLVGCKIQIDVPVGGKVVTKSGNFECLSGQVCSIDVYDTDFDEIFVAIADPGYRFSNWRKRKKGLCGGKDLPCWLPTTGFWGHDGLMSILESDTVFYLTPIFANEHTSRLAAGGEYRAGQGSNCLIDKTGVRCWGDRGQSAVPTDLRNPYHIDVSMHICALDDSGVRCWGRNDYGQSDVPNDLVNPYLVSVGEDYTCVLHAPGVRCWGNNLYGQTDAPKLINPRQISSDVHSCAIDDTGVVCWGAGVLNHWGQENVPSGLVNPRQVEVGLSSTCVIDDNGVHCWGQHITDPPFKPINPRDMVMGNEFACVLDDVGVRCWGNVPGDIPDDLLNPREIAAADSHWCVLDDTGVHCQPANFAGGESKVPNNLVNPSEVSAGRDYTCAIDDSGVRCWGLASNHDIINPRRLSTGPSHACAIGDNGVSCWGSNQFGESSVPPGLVNPVEVSVGQWHSCAIDDYGVHCWGGHPWFSNESPSNLIEPHGMVSTYYDNCVLDYGLVKCWGTKNNPAPKPNRQRYVNPRQIQLGWGGLCVLDDNGVQCSEKQSEVPTNLIDPIMISTGGNACAIDANGVTCWGWNDYGQSNAPKGLVNPRQISVGYTHACALDDTGVHCWGSGEGDAADAPTQKPPPAPVTYGYEGNYFNEFEGVPPVFSASDKVIARFTIDCSVAHSSGNCRNLPYADYFKRGAIDIGSLLFSAGPARLPTSGDSAQIQRFLFSTDSAGRIEEWDIDLFLSAPLLNIDTDNVNDGIDSAVALGGGATVHGHPGTWTILENPN